MAMKDEVKEQQQKLKGKTAREKLEYFWDYYKVHTIVALFVVFTAGIFIKDMISSKDTAFSAVVLNSYGFETQEDFQADFSAYAGIDTNAYHCLIDATSTLSLESMTQIDFAFSQRLAGMVQTNGLDAFVSDPLVFGHYAEEMLFRDLRKELSNEEYLKYEPYFYYIDAAAIEEKNKIDEAMADVSSEISATQTDPTNPSAMTDPIPVGIYLDNSTKLAEWNCYANMEETPIFGFVETSNRMDISHLFLQYLTD